MSEEKLKIDPETDRASRDEIAAMFSTGRIAYTTASMPQTFIMLTAIQLAMRHPEIGSGMLYVLAGIVRNMMKLFADYPATTSILEKGMDPRFDIPIVEADTAVDAQAAAYKISDHDIQELEAIIGGTGDWFGAHLIRLIKKADYVHRRKLAVVYPTHVAAVERWEVSPTKGN